MTVKRFFVHCAALAVAGLLALVFAACPSDDGEQVFQITRLPAAGGDFEVAAAATAGSRVTLTAVPDRDYEHYGWAISPAAVVPVRVGVSDVWEFTMPASNVIIHAEFRPANGGSGEFAINRMAVVGDGDFEVVARAEAGDTVTLTATPGEYYEHHIWRIVPNTVVPVRVGASDVWTFLMPSADVSIWAEFRQAVFRINRGEISGDGDFEADPRARAGEQVTITAVPAQDYILHRWVIDPNTVIPVRVGASDVWTFLMPSAEVTVGADFRYTGIPPHAGTEPVPGYAPGTFPAPRGWEDRADEWRLVWNDEFQGAELNRERWNIDTGVGSHPGIVGWGNAELQYYRSENIRVRDGMLVIEAGNQPHGIGGQNRGFTSGKIVTGATRFSPGYGGAYQPQTFAIAQGFIEASMRSPRGTGFWPAFWTLGTNINVYDAQGNLTAARNWPYSGEIDIMEIRGHEAGPPHGPRFMSTIHHGIAYPAQRWFPGASMWFDGREQPIGVGQQHIDAGRVVRRTPAVLPDGVDLANEFHVYGVRWDREWMDFYFNGVNWVSIDLRNLQGGPYANPEAFTAPHGQFININLAIGGNFLPEAYRAPNPASFAPTAPWEERSLSVKWVRVHERVK